MSILETERLVIREWELSDWELLRPLARDERVLRYIPVSKPWTDERIRGFVKEAMELRETRGWILWPVIHREDGRLIGTCGFWHTFLPDIEIGWRLHPDYWGRGLMTEAASAVLEYGWEAFGFDRVIAVAQSANKQSIRIMQKLGMVFEKKFVHSEAEVVRYGAFNPLKAAL
ncbi:MAG: GNAT family N-acetyltransferase [Planctomycetota bacterium]|jgi:RimJ/RimL family protein N-acetyltransferase